MPRWNTEQIEAALSQIGEVGISGQGGSYDTDNLWVCPTGRPDGDHISVAGFRPGQVIPEDQTGDVDGVEYVEVRNCYSDSDGGLQSDDEEICIIYGRVIALMRKMGFMTIRHYDQIF